MFENECIDEMLTRFTKITNDLSSLGDKIDNDQKIRKIIRALPKSWEVKATTFKELNDREEMDISGFISNLKTHEMEMNVREEKEAPKKKAIAFKATSSSFDEDESSEDYDECWPKGQLARYFDDNKTYLIMSLTILFKRISG